VTSCGHFAADQRQSGCFQRTSEFRKRVTVSRGSRIVQANASHPIALRICYPEECPSNGKAVFLPKSRLVPPPCNSGHRITASVIRDYTFGKSGIPVATCEHAICFRVIITGRDPPSEIIERSSLVIYRAGISR